MTRNKGCNFCKFLNKTLDGKDYSCSNDNATVFKLDLLNGQPYKAEVIHPFKKNIDCTCKDFEHKNK